MRYNECMELSLDASHFDYLIAQEEKRYGAVLGKIIGKGISAPEPLAELLAIATRHEALKELRLKYLTPAPIQAENPVVDAGPLDEEAEGEAEDGLPDGICNSESCTDEFCVEYWESVENNGD